MEEQGGVVFRERHVEGQVAHSTKRMMSRVTRRPEDTSVSTDFTNLNRLYAVRGSVSQDAGRQDGDADRKAPAGIIMRSDCGATRGGRGVVPALFRGDRLRDRERDWRRDAARAEDAE